MRRSSSLLLIALALFFASPALAADGAKGGIAWYGTWEGGMAEAKRSGRPILLIAAAPHCRNVPGKW